MMLNGVDTVFQDGKYWEIINFAAKRYGVSGKTIQEHLGKELFRAEDPRTGIMMICGALPDGIKRISPEGARVGGYLKIITFLILIGIGTAVWVVTGNPVVMGVFVGIGIAMVCTMASIAKDKDGKTWWDKIPAYDEGGIFGWQVPCSAAKADIDWMFGDVLKGKR